ncbi:uncharacterized protein LOC128680575 isoform X1 [Plodia interpunctella]|uniref:uncharacterized protein LOC128680575 isoform X1 n=1 Tax=Plodia interpunctella TaxID=58824 RepID=UPI002368689A|nr:uncharacterized protein LOC128680575 isoform X1 [Plodia interpunctella]
MTAIVFLFALILGHAAAVIELSCSDNATCIDNLAREVVKNLKQQKSVKVFDSLTIEPLGRRQARSNEGPLTKFLKNHAFSYDWGDFTFRVSKPEDRSDVLDLELFEVRSAKDVSDINSKKSTSKNVEEKEIEKTPKGINRRKRRVKKKVLQAVLPMLFGMKSTAVVLFLLAVVTVLTLKAFVASKLALAVTVGMAVKKLYESYASGVGLTNPYLYSQYPIDFPSAASNAYSVSGVNPQFGSPEMFSPTALGTHPHHELLQQGDASAQSSQQAPALLLNTTRAAERWDGIRKRPMFYGTSRATSGSSLAYQKYRH